jgi:hypothetical protein
MQCQKIQRKVVTPSAAAIGQADGQVSTALPDGGHHDESDFAFRIMADLTTKPGKTFSRFINPRVITPPFGCQPCEFDGFPDGSGGLPREPRKALMIASQFNLGRKPQIRCARLAIDLDPEREFVHRISSYGGS